ncbi:CCN family member 1-like [Brachionichthys hirsutus]|uniref:CCN family member 1-like n=1 Tax=Brachionichthys hirsutus TaxID=412623 RepID=UPI003604E29F
MWRLSALVIFCITTVSALCPKDCHCPPDADRCAAGVGLIVDGCGCCKVCARQLFQDCSKTRPCDHTKGLVCHIGGGYGPAKGICRAKTDGRTCEYNNKIHQNGEIFRPNCKHQCTCMDGAVGCVSLCPHELTLPKQVCANPSRGKLGRQCCERLVCQEESNKSESSVAKKRKTKHSKDSRPSENDLANSKELDHVWREFKSLPDFGSRLMGHMLSGRVKCVPKTTAWSPCSKSCGTGLSTRAANSNPQCKLVKETRLCEVRPCSQIAFHRLKKGQRCKRTEKASRPVKLTYAGCRSLKKVQLRYCGSCIDGRCCSPHRTQTSSVRFRCRNGRISSRMVMMIESCKCNLNCPSSNTRAATPCRVLNDTS